MSLPGSNFFPFLSLKLAQHGAEEMEALSAFTTGVWLVGGQSENQDVMLGAPSPREAESFLWGLNTHPIWGRWGGEPGPLFF